MPSCSLIVPTYNRLAYLKKCLDSLFELDILNLEQLEIIIVNDGSTDGTKEYLDSLPDKKIRVLHNGKNLGISQARNTGIKAAKYDLLAFTDDDCVVAGGWLKNLLLIFENPEVGFAFGPTFYITAGHRAYFPEKVVKLTGWPGGGNIAFRRQVFERCGYFNSYFEDNYYNEDTEMAIRAVSQGFKYKYAANAVVNHQSAYWTVKNLLKSAKNASVWPVLKKKYPRHYRCFNPPISLGFFVHSKDYLYILLSPILIPFLLIRYIIHGKRDFKIFFTKWPIYLFLRRWYIYQEAIKNKVFML